MDQLAIFGVPLAFIWTAFAVELTPGPNMTYLAVVTLSEGRKAGLATVAGVALGLLIVGVLAAIGLATLIASSPVLFAALRWGGVFYLLWLAYDIWRGGDELLNENIGDGRAFVHFQRGLVTNLLNPKSAIFYLAVIPQFIDSTRSILPQSLALSAAYVLIATMIHAGIVMLSAHARPFLANTGRMEAIRRGLALSVVIIALWLLWSTRS